VIQSGFSSNICDGLKWSYENTKWGTVCDDYMRKTVNEISHHDTKTSNAEQKYKDITRKEGNSQESNQSFSLSFLSLKSVWQEIHYKCQEPNVLFLSLQVFQNKEHLMWGQRKSLHQKEKWNSKREGKIRSVIKTDVSEKGSKLKDKPRMTTLKECVSLLSCPSCHSKDCFARCSLGYLWCTSFDHCVFVLVIEKRTKGFKGRHCLPLSLSFSCDVCVIFLRWWRKKKRRKSLCITCPLISRCVLDLFSSSELSQPFASLSLSVISTSLVQLMNRERSLPLK
jgi:hypothetical protein